MTPESMRLWAVAALAEEFDRTHDDAHADADRWIGLLIRQGWRPLPALADRPGPRVSTPSETARAHLADARAVVERKKRERQQREAGGQ